MPKTWILAGDSSRVRIFEASSPKLHLQEIADFANPQGRGTNRDLRTDSYGHYSGTVERAQGETAEPRIDAITHEVEMFSKEVGKYLDKARTEHRYNKLRLIAPPKFLGMIRQNLGKEAQKLVDEELVKDVSRLSVREIEEYLQKQKQ